MRHDDEPKYGERTPNGEPALDNDSILRPGVDKWFSEQEDIRTAHAKADVVLIHNRALVWERLSNTLSILNGVLSLGVIFGLIATVRWAVLTWF